jgi:hypothetical protein
LLRKANFSTVIAVFAQIYVHGVLINVNSMRRIIVSDVQLPVVNALKHAEKWLPESFIHFFSKKE